MDNLTKVIHSMRILLIEDDSDIAHFLKTSLEAECFVVDIATDGERGSYLARVNEYDIIILDNILPKKNGLEVCHDIRQAKKTTPILSLSIESGVDQKISMLDCGADDYLTKPFSFKELIARVHALLRRPAALHTQTLQIGDLHLDPYRHNVARGGKQIYLTRKEFLLLEYLMRNPGIVLTRGMILEHVWDMNADPHSNTIEVHIRSLRKKIARPKSKELIKTIPGRGYKIEV